MKFAKEWSEYINKNRENIVGGYDGEDQHEIIRAIQQDAISTPPAVKAVAVSGEQADILHSLHNVLGEAYAGKMGISQLSEARWMIKRLWEIYAQQAKCVLMRQLAGILDQEQPQHIFIK